MARDILDHNPTVDHLKSRFGESILKTEVFRNELTVTVQKERIVDVLQFLRDEAALAYTMLTDLTVVDRLKMEKSPRFMAVYHLRSMTHGRRVRIKAPITEKDCTIASIHALWKSANWMEREAYEMYGVTFEGHPDLRRLLTPETFTAYPLRKDYPLRGRGERDVVLPEGS